MAYWKDRYSSAEAGASDEKIHQYSKSVLAFSH